MGSPVALVNCVMECLKNILQKQPPAKHRQALATCIPALSRRAELR
jgi:hypothetical protein